VAGTDRPGVVEFAYVTTGEDGKDVVITSGEFSPGAEPPADGDSVTLGQDGVEKPWKVLRSVETAYAGLTIYVEPLEFE
jgi:hypothetical protein